MEGSSAVKATTFLGPKGQELLMEHCRLGFAPCRWLRFVLRLLDRQRWHWHGLLLWLLQRAYLRFLPFPYPSISSVDQWKSQAQSMMESGAFFQPHYNKGFQLGRYTAANLREMSFFRDRVGWKDAFLEDGMLTGLLAARGVRGQSSRLKAVVLAEAKEEASKKKSQMDRDMAARQLVGPRGGLPSLRADLVKLAVLLHQEVGAKDTVAQLQAKCRPLVQFLRLPLPRGLLAMWWCPR